MHIKTVADWELDVLACPYGGPQDGRDAHGEYFSLRTNFHAEQIPLPPVLYYHGCTAEGYPQGEPEWIGRTVDRDVRPDGVWYRVVLDKTNEYARRVWAAAQRGLARASTGTMTHLLRVARDGEILHWLVSELSLFDVGPGRQPANSYAVALPVVKALYGRLGMEVTMGDFDTVLPSGEQLPLTAGGDGMITLSRADLQAAIQQAVHDGRQQVSPQSVDVQQLVQNELVRERARVAQEAEAQRAEELRIQAEVQRRVSELQMEAVKGRRLPFAAYGAPLVTQYHTLRPYDHLDAGSQATLVMVLGAAQRVGHSAGPSDQALKALAVKLSEDKTEVGRFGWGMLSGMGVKANEIMQSGLNDFGDEWVAVSYSTELWQMIAQQSFLWDMMPKIQVPKGMESITLPMDLARPKWYNVAQVANEDATMKRPVATVPSSKLSTEGRVLTLGKLGARVGWSEELNEDSIIPFATEIKNQLALSGAETLEHVLIDGDTVLTADTNINAVGAAQTPPSLAAYTVFDGLRKNAILNASGANRRDASASLSDDDFMATLRLMGPAGKNALDKQQVAFLIDASTNYKVVTLAAVKSRDVFEKATIEDGELTRIYGRRVYVSSYACNAQAESKTNALGKIDTAADANNIYGQILAVRFDQWKAGWKRLFTIEVQRLPYADSWEVVSFARVGLTRRDNEASAITTKVALT